MKRAVVVGALLLVGCRTVWVHPEATADKYASDLFFCQRGIELSEWRETHETSTGTRSDRAWALGDDAAPAAELPGWKHCMIRLGWDTRVGFRSEAPWSSPTAARKRGGRGT